jgi:dihydroorotate dehydrogenase
MFHLEAETAHDLGIAVLKSGVLGSGGPPRYSEFGEIKRFGLDFANPIGIAAGFDKNGVAINGLAASGFGFVEVGTVTLAPQPGNPKPRMFRLPSDMGLLNRLGFNNDGAAVVAERISRVRPKCVVGVNIGKNKDVPIEAATENYLRCFDLLYAAADYIVVNISSPNTPNLRDLQKAAPLDELLRALTDRRAEFGGTKPILIKISPDLSEAEVENIVGVAMENKIAAIIATNTTLNRDGLMTRGARALGAGGVSGRPLADTATNIISMIYRLSNGRLPIVGVGGIFTAEDAFTKIAAGASLLQAYTGFIYLGPSFPSKINQGLAEILRRRGFRNLDEAVGSAATTGSVLL